MDKESAFELLKWIVLQLRDNPKKLKDDSVFGADWLAKQQYLETSIQAMSEADHKWLDAQYGPWYKKEIEPHVSKLDPSLFQTSS